MNCLEMILYAAYRCGEITPQQIQNYYSRSSIIGGRPNVARLFGNLGWNKSLPDLRGFEREGRANRVPTVGEVIFFTKRGDLNPQHIALSLGGDIVISLHEDRPIPIIGDIPFDVDPVRRIRINELPNIENYIVQVGLPISEVLKTFPNQ